MMNMELRCRVRHMAFTQMIGLLKLAGKETGVNEILDEYIAAFAEAWEEVKREAGHETSGRHYQN